MKQGDEVVVVYATVPKKDFGDVKFPPGSFVKCYDAGLIDDFIHPKKCAYIGQIVSLAMNALAKKACPNLDAKVIGRFSP